MESAMGQAPYSTIGEYPGSWRIIEGQEYVNNVIHNDLFLCRFACTLCYKLQNHLCTMNMILLEECTKGICNSTLLNYPVVGYFQIDNVVKSVFFFDPINANKIKNKGDLNIASTCFAFFQVLTIHLVHQLLEVNSSSITNANIIYCCSHCFGILMVFNT
uniref:Uncharacterized protein n=1 Tax=Strigamia maritima TaxID=126957 RepID=T1J5E7_STRMM